MGHGITETDGFFSVRERPWHGLGVLLDDYPTRDEAYQIAFGWEPVDTLAYRETPTVSENGVLGTTFEPIEGSSVRQRSDNGQVLGVVNDTLGIVTNSELMDVGYAVAEASGGQAYAETAGSLNGGKQVFLLMRLAEPILVKGDPNGATIPYFALQNHHTGGGAFRGQAVNTRIVCANTSAAADVEAKKSGYEFSFRHGSRVSEKVEEAKAAVELWRAGVAAWKQAMEHLVTIRIDAETREHFVQMFQPMPPERLITDRVRANVEEARQQLRDVLNSPTGEGINDTAFGLYQAGIEWRQHVQRVKGQDAETRMANRFRRHMISNDRFTADTLELVKEVAGV